MSDKEGSTSASERSAKISEAYERLHRLEKLDRREWVVLTASALVLALSLLLLSLTGAESLFTQPPFRVASRITFLLLAVLVIRAWRQQRRLARRRRELSSDLAVIASSETLSAAIGNPPAGVERRVLSRILCDERLAVFTVEPGSSRPLFGRILDLSEEGLGAIVPTVLNLGQHVILEFSLGDGQREHPSNLIRVDAVVRQRNGFRYGFSFLMMDESGRNRIMSYRTSAKVVTMATRGNAE